MERAFPVISVAGTARQMGYQHGKQAAPLIQKYLRWMRSLSGMPTYDLLRNALRFSPIIQRLSPRYMEEVAGLAEGAGISMAEAMLCQVRSEAAMRTAERGCTAFALTRSATAGGAPLAGQNQDLQAGFADVAIVLKVKPNDGRPAAVMLTFAGQLGYAGMNQYGVANFANALYNYTWRLAMPYYPLRRCFLEQKNVEGCLRILKKYPTCSAANLVWCDGSGSIADVEVRPEALSLFQDANKDALVHTNNYVAKGFKVYERGTLPDSCARRERFSQMVQQQWGKITVDRLKHMLADHKGYPGSICRHGANGLFSICGYIAEPSKGLFHVRRGYGCTGYWDVHRVV